VVIILLVLFFIHLLFCTQYNVTNGGHAKETKTCDDEFVFIAAILDGVFYNSLHLKRTHNEPNGCINTAMKQLKMAFIASLKDVVLT
jgi:hypothetical protein